MIEFDISASKSGFFMRFRKSPDRYIETMPVPDEFLLWRKGKTDEVNKWLETKKDNDRVARLNKDAK